MECPYLVSGYIHAHHSSIATILIAPSVQDSKSIKHQLISDNLNRVEHTLKYGTDPGRSKETDWFRVGVAFPRCVSALH